MSLAVHSYLRDLYGKEERSDCSVVFVLAQNVNGSKRRKLNSSSHAVPHQQPSEIRVGELPAHLLLLCSGSAFFRALVDRWTDSRPIHGGKPKLRVTLARAEEVPDALVALRFIYTGQVEATDVAQLLRVRRLAAYLQVEGCVEACDEALLKLASGEARAQMGQALGQPGHPRLATALDWIAQTYTCRHLLPAPDEDPGAANLWHRLSDCVLANPQIRQGGRGQTALSGTVKVAELLVWVLPDAPSVLNDPVLKLRMQSLSADAMETLLSSDSFGTDNESTVLLMLAEWLHAQPRTPPGVRERLCKLIRLRKLDYDYLLCVLPHLTWFPISRAEHCFVCRCAVADDVFLDELAGAAGGVYDCTTPWYRGVQRPCVRSDAGRPYVWSVRQEDLAAEVAQMGPREDVYVYATFGHATTGGTLRCHGEHVVANGFHWQVALQYSRGAEMAGIHLHCELPAALKAGDPDSVAGFAYTGNMTLAVYRRPQSGGGRGDLAFGHNCRYGTPCIGMRWGWAYALRLEAQSGPAAAATSAPAGVPAPGVLARWAAYLHDGKVSGHVVWAQEEGDSDSGGSDQEDDEDEEEEEEEEEDWDGAGTSAAADGVARAGAEARPGAPGPGWDGDGGAGAGDALTAIGGGGGSGGGDGDRLGAGTGGPSAPEAAEAGAAPGGSTLAGRAAAPADSDVAAEEVLARVKAQVAAEWHSRWRRRWAGPGG